MVTLELRLQPLRPEPMSASQGWLPPSPTPRRRKQRRQQDQQHQTPQPPGKQRLGGLARRVTTCTSCQCSLRTTEATSSERPLQPPGRPRCRERRPAGAMVPRVLRPYWRTVPDCDPARARQAPPILE